MIADFLARWVVRRPATLFAAMVLLAAGSAAVIFSGGRFDTDILNLLPADNQAVAGLKRYNSDFAQTRELAFLIEGPDPASASAAHAGFVAALRTQPWVVRVLESSPARAESFLSPRALAPLVLNLPSDEFDKVLAALEPGAISSRLEALVRRARAGSPAAMAELSADPLGVAGPAAARALATLSLEESFQMESDDGLAFVVPVVTNLDDPSADASRALMRDVRAFLDEQGRALGAGIALGVTGRAAYVEEIAASMESDLRLTSTVSALGVLLIFWLGFRRLLPLVGIGLILGLTAMATLATGMLSLGQLNLIAISFCSILFGLGDDFSLLLCQRYYHARSVGDPRETAIARALREAMPGIFCVALTTAVGFLALCLSGSAGMAQLGALVALGVLLCSLFMPLFVFLFLFGRSEPQPAATGPVLPFLSLCQRAPRATGWTVWLAGLAVVGIAVSPWRAIGFDLSPSSLEPRNTPAALTLARMLERFSNTYEPVMVIVENPDAPKLEALDRVLRELEAEGLAQSLSTPSGLFLDPSQAGANASRIPTGSLARAAAAMEEVSRTTGLSEAATRSGLRLLEALRDPDVVEAGWGGVLAPDSPWWFVIERMIAPDGLAAIAYFKVPENLDPATRIGIAERIREALPGVSVTGWSQSLASLVPWATGELAGFGSAVVVVILVLLALVYRDIRMWLVHGAAMVLGIAGTLATLKLFDARVNLLNVLAFPLILAVGVDYGTHVLLVAKEKCPSLESLAGVLKAVALSALTTAAGFGALALASNPSLAGLGFICATGVIWSLIATLAIVAPGVLRRIAQHHAAASLPR